MRLLLEVKSNCEVVVGVGVGVGLGVAVGVAVVVGVGVDVEVGVSASGVVASTTVSGASLFTRPFDTAAATSPAVPRRSTALAASTRRLAAEPRFFDGAGLMPADSSSSAGSVGLGPSLSRIRQASHRRSTFCD
ncbi:hypothetical protein EG850_08315 [Gulosibacter macacae]|uniref:Uncharacterized protein n=1 Tax=Gulosibacter macacae TaxID=2488791 RepID=A0A3P3VYX7_9MICO|nr:hypothetical protein EG850_08315 [Gulosibacter macacae]